MKVPRRVFGAPFFGPHPDPAPLSHAWLLACTAVIYLVASQTLHADRAGFPDQARCPQIPPDWTAYDIQSTLSMHMPRACHTWPVLKAVRPPGITLPCPVLLPGLASLQVSQSGSHPAEPFKSFLVVPLDPTSEDPFDVNPKTERIDYEGLTSVRAHFLTSERGAVTYPESVSERPSMNP